MRILINIKTEVEEENSERASDTIKTINNFYHGAHTKTKRAGDSKIFF